MLLADERHDFIRTFYPISPASTLPRWRRSITRWWRRRRRACATPADAERQIHLDLRLCGQEFHVAGTGDFGAAPAGDWRTSARVRSLYEHRSPIIPPMTGRSVKHPRRYRKPRKLTFHASPPAAAPTGAPARAYFSDPRKPLLCPILRARLSAPERRRGPADPGHAPDVRRGETCTVAPRPS